MTPLVALAALVGSTVGFLAAVSVWLLWMERR